MPTNNCYELRRSAWRYEKSEDPLKDAVEDAIKDLRIDASVWEISAHWGDEDHKKIVIVVPLRAPNNPDVWPMDHLLAPYYTHTPSGNTQVR